MFANVVARTVRVSCTAPGCPSDPVDVPLYYAGKGVIACPGLLCAGCMGAMAIVEEEGDARA